MRTRSAPAAGEVVRGELVSFRVLGADFWGVGTVRTLAEGGEVDITGKLLGVNIGDTVELEGMHTSGKYGAQFKVQSCRVVLPCDTSGVVGWLASKLPSIGRRRAEALVQRFGVAGLWEVLGTNDVDQLATVDGITRDSADAICEAYRTHLQDRDRIVRFKSFGLTDNQIARVLQAWGDSAEERITRNPYDLIDCVPLFGWMRADALALRIGVRRDDAGRLAAGLVHAMQTATQAGHCFVASGKLVALATQKVCGLSDEQPVRRALDGLCERGKLVRIEQNIYLPKIASAEGRLAQVFATRAKRGRERAA